MVPSKFNFKVISIVFTVLTVYTAANQVLSSPIEIQSGFEFLGNVDGKTLVRPIYTDTSDYLTYQEAIIKCTTAGYRIATVETQGQSDLLKEYVSTAPFRWAWIDGVDFQTPDAFFSINTGKNLTFLDWIPGQPVVGKDDYNCIGFGYNIFDGPGFYDLECKSYFMTVICEA